MLHLLNTLLFIALSAHALLHATAHPPMPPCIPHRARCLPPCPCALTHTHAPLSEQKLYSPGFKARLHKLRTEGRANPLPALATEAAAAAAATTKKQTKAAAAVASAARRAASALSFWWRAFLASFLAALQPEE